MLNIENITLRDSAGYGLQLRNSQINGSDELADFEDQISFPIIQQEILQSKLTLTSPSSHPGIDLPKSFQKI